jgi:hypothetical protein
MITDLAIGSAVIPQSKPGETVAVVISLQSPMPSAKYDVLILRAASIPLSDIKVTKQTATEVTVTITRPNGHSGAGSIHVICVERAGKPVTVPPKGS